MTQWIAPLDGQVAPLEAVGGKGVNLIRLTRAGFPVPAGFILTTAAYRATVDHNDLQQPIDGALRQCDPTDPDSLTATSETIRSAFTAAAVPDTIATAVEAAYADLGSGPVAVRSSATAEDLPGHSFAGQQDTFLNVRGSEALRDAVKRCWSSLWTARAIGYRARNGIGHAQVALAVVVQQMVESEVSGVLFTANPVTGRRDEFVVDATFGLGEALVGGHVEPDHFVLAPDGAVRQVTVGAKQIAMHGSAEGGIVRSKANAAGRRTLDDRQLARLAAAGRSVAQLYETPQDVEWALADGELYLLQSRPVTTLFPLPAGAPGYTTFFSFASVQGVMDPITPLGQDVIRRLLNGTARALGFRGPNLVATAGERLYVAWDPLLNARLTRRFVLAFIGAIDPPTGTVLEQLIAAGEYPPPRPLSLRARLSVLRLLLTIVPTFIRSVLRPDRARHEMNAIAEEMVVANRMRARGAPRRRDAAETTGRIGNEILGTLVLRFLPRFAPGMAALNLLPRLTGRDAMPLTRGLPHNVTTAMDLALWETAERIRADDAALAYCLDQDTERLVADYQAGALPDAAQNGMASFLQRYGMRGLAEIDLGRPRWREAPGALLEALRSYLQMEEPEQAPPAVFARGERAAESELENQVEAVAGGPAGALRTRLVRAAAYRVRALAGMRETPKFTVIRVFGHLRTRLLEIGETLVAEGWLDQPEDISFLHLRELRQKPDADWRRRVARRRERFEREQRRSQIPRILLADGRAFYDGMQSDGDGLRGSPVSPGVVEGPVRVVFDPHRARLQPGDILVCPGTDPSWTPLFLAAGGLITEVGGLMTHGSVVAREYGIPAVVGVHEATRRLRDGQRIRLDGGNGVIQLLETSES